MHINWTTTAAMPQYASPQLQEALRRRISEATDDDLLAAHLHWIEGQVVLDWFGEACELAVQLQHELEAVDALVSPSNSPFSRDYQLVHAALRQALNEESTTVNRAKKQTGDNWRQLRVQTTGDLAPRYWRHADTAGSPVNKMGTVKAQLARAAQNMNDALARHRNDLHQLALLEADLDRFLHTEDSISVEDIHGMTPAAFERAVAALARRDGCRILREGGGARDLGADVIAVAPDSRRIVFQCKHRQAGLKKVGSPEIQTLNGTARPEHRADIVVAVTNATFTKPATDFAHDHEIHLVDQARLHRWARWGEPLLAVLGIDETGPRTALSLAQLERTSSGQRGRPNLGHPSMRPGAR
ncbi:restriction endonuclease [Streptomyces sp. NPDC048272]|uniref:restriction endonuclease n=1 Tax=Streptomyces sp. NPDC048272 TaxID=3154616 RepID=UPI0034210E98